MLVLSSEDEEITMKIVRVERFGGPEVLQIVEMPDTAPGPGDVAVDVEAAGVLFVDTMIRRGQGGPSFPVEPPYFPGAGAAGRVAEVGDGVDSEWVGRRVLADVRAGGYAERLVTGVDRLIPIPATLGSAEAMALLHDGSTASAVFDAIGVRPGETMLVLPAAGGLGSLLVQLGRSAGARVIGAARGDRKLALARSLGAAATVDYGDPAWTDEVRSRFGPVDVVFDGVGDVLGRASFELVVQGGRFSNYGVAGGSPTRVDPGEAHGRNLRVLGMEQLAAYPVGRAARAARMLRDAAAGRIRPAIGRTFPLEKAADAHAALENREIAGKALLTVGR
jgi:NADPH2:quinone reductase